MSITGYATVTPVVNGLRFRSRVMGTGTVAINAPGGMPEGYKLAVIQNALPDCNVTATYARGAQSGRLGAQYLDAGPHSPYMTQPMLIASGSQVRAVNLSINFHDGPDCTLGWDLRETGELVKAEAGKVFQSWLVLIRPDGQRRILDNYIWSVDWEAENNEGSFTAGGSCSGIGKNGRQPVTTGTLANQAAYVFT
jgi:hypothetical protein